MDLTDKSFEQEISGSKGVKVVDFWASWCMPCKMLAPVIDKLSERFTDVGFYKVNVDTEAALAMGFQISSIPAVLIFKDGELAERSVGFCEEDELAEIIGKYL